MGMTVSLGRLEGPGQGEIRSLGETFVCWKISGAVSSELTVELLRNRLPQELLLIAKTGRSSSDARTGCPATGPTTWRWQ